MGADLPEIAAEEFSRRLQRVAPRTLEPGLCATLYEHYRELKRWNRRLSLVGPGTRDQVVERHYGESLAALPWILDTDRTLVDIGSGAGFPGMVLAAACPSLDVTLVEARERKWAFLLAAADRCGLSVHCLGATVGAALPENLARPIDLVTVRAVRLGSRQVRALAGAASPGGRLLAWSGRDDSGDLAGWVRSREALLIGSHSRRLVEYHLEE